MPTQNILVFDIETAPLPAEELERVKPKFTPKANLKKEETIKKDLEEQEQKWIESAALNAITGKVLAIGYQINNQPTCIIDGKGDEAEILKTFWELVRQQRECIFVGFNIGEFDIPFLIRRSHKHDITPVFYYVKRVRGYLPRVFDARDDWALGEWKASGTLGQISAMMGGKSKLDGAGKLFYRLWQEDRKAAVAYIERDIEMTAFVAERLGTYDRAQRETSF